MPESKTYINSDDILNNNDMYPLLKQHIPSGILNSEGNYKNFIVDMIYPFLEQKKSLYKRNIESINYCDEDQLPTTLQNVISLMGLNFLEKFNYEVNKLKKIVLSILNYLQVNDNNMFAFMDFLHDICLINDNYTEEFYTNNVIMSAYTNNVIIQYFYTNKTVTTKYKNSKSVISDPYFKKIVIELRALEVDLFQIEILKTIIPLRMPYIYFVIATKIREILLNENNETLVDEDTNILYEPNYVNIL
jgi:hypothetical protein